MKRLSMIMVCLFAMMAASTGLKAQEISILLRPGWNWIGYPYPETVDLENAFGDFEPMADDVIESFWGYSEYVAGYGWFGGIDELKPGWGYMYYSNRTESVTIVFSPSSPTVEPITVTTAEPTEITAISAVSGGSITSNNGSYVFVLEKGICWATHPNPMVMNDFFTENGNGAESFTAEMTDLTPNTVYYVRAYAVTQNGTTYGEEMSFTTQSGIPTLTTIDVTDITGESATSGGIIIDSCGLVVNACGVCWSITPNPTIVNSHTTNSGRLGSFNSNMTGMNVSTTYYVRAYATTIAGTGYGEQKTFITRDGIPILITADVTDISCYWATSGGNISDDGGLSIAERGVCWSTLPNPTVANPHTVDGNGKGSFSSSITGLNRNTIYYVRAYATNSNTTVYGDEICLTTLDYPLGAIEGLFSVSDSQQVWFSKGNLQYKASTNTWRFADNQYDYIGNANSYASYSYNGWIDLFGWGTSGWHDSSDPYNLCYQPWSTSQANTYTNFNPYGYGPSTNMASPNLTDGSANYDWGVYNPIYNGGNSCNQWRTLTNAEWSYVLSTRTTFSGIRYAKAKVNGVNGLILLPDNWETSYFPLNNTNTISASVSYSTNTISIAQWNTLEQYGAVFLPAAGHRYGSSVLDEGQDGNYWSSTQSNSAYSAKGLYFYEFTAMDGHNDRYVGHSVRLVVPVEN